MVASILAEPTAERLTVPRVFNMVQAKELIEQPESPSDMLDMFGHDPEKFAVDGPVRVSHRELADGRTVSTWSYRLLELPQALDIDALAARVRKAKPHAEKATGDAHWFVYQAGDLQIGKRARDGGTADVVEFYLESLARAVKEFKSLKRHGIAGVLLSFPGDCIEGNVSQGGKNMGTLTDATVPEQTRIFRRLLLQTVEAFAPLVDQVLMPVVNGNHDQAQRQLNTYPGDGWATECAISVSDALEMNPAAYGHVDVRIPDRWEGHLTLPVGDSIVTVAHGHQWPRGKGMTWWANQAFNLQQPAASGVLQHGHIHTFEVETTRDRTRVSSPTFDTGSDWFRETRGGDSKRGGLVYLLAANEVSRLSVV